MPDDQDRAAFAEVRDALMPPGADKDALWSALKNAQLTGGHVPGRTAPDISGPVPRELADLIMQQETRRRELRASAALDPALLPSDPFAAGAPAAAALHEMFLDFTGAGFTEDQATSILGKMLAAYGAAGDKDAPA